MSISTRSNRRQKFVTVERGNLSATGTTKSEAKLNLECKIDEALAGYYSPIAFTYKGNVCLVWREIDGWTYRIVRDDKLATNERHDLGWSQSPNQDKNLVIRGAVRHFVSGMSSCDDIHTDADIPAFVEDVRDRADIVKDFRRYRAHAFALKTMPELNDYDRNNWIAENLSSPMFD